MSKIEWTDKTWNPIIGCSKISEGCNNCYAEKMAGRLENIESTQYYSKVLKNFNNKVIWNGKTYLLEKILEKPYHWKKHQKIFVSSMGDLFHESVPFEWIDMIIDVVRDNPHHTFIFLTKRPKIMKQYFKELYGKNKFFEKD